ncbi:MAG: NUDIX domain-containing protein [Planctomycetes bacterium]|nr:NUDIX domain-containing protein [Planctomycetota bacterium]
MTRKISAGILIYRFRDRKLETLLAHPGGPFYARKDEGSWSIPKGEVEEGEPLLEAAVREFEEEIGMKPEGEFLPLGSVRQKSGKEVHAWAVSGDWTGPLPASNTFSMVWPPGSGKVVEFPEIDRAEFFGLGEARRKINPAQAEFLDRLAERIKATPAP